MLLFLAHSGGRPLPNMRQLFITLATLIFVQLAWAGGYPLRVETVQDSVGKWSIHAHNAGASPVYVDVILNNRVNVRTASQFGGTQQKVLEPGAKEVLLSIYAEDPAALASFEYEARWVFGRGTAKVEHQGVYRAPFPGDLTFDTINSAGAPHVGARLANAVDILMPVGTPVIAARSGFAMDVAGQAGGDEIEGGSPYYEDRTQFGNYVRILHDDGTWAEYLHLKDGSVTVRNGARVEAGTQIALSGATGIASRPHLHFAVMKPTQGLLEPVSQPLRMEMAGRGEVLVRIGDTIGASRSVIPDAATMKRDPLLVAATKAGQSNKTAGVYTSSDEPGFAVANLLFFGFGVVVAAIGGLAIFLISRRKKATSWRAVFAPFIARLRKEEGSAPAGSAQNDERTELSGEVDLRPEAGYLTAPWEAAFYASASLAMPFGYAGYPKVSLNRLLPRPPWVRTNPEGVAFLRGESIDLLIVRVSTGEIVAAVDIERDYERFEGQAFAAKAKRDMLRVAKIAFFLVRSDIGPEAFRSQLEAVAPPIMASSLRHLPQRGAMAAASA